MSENAEQNGAGGALVMEAELAAIRAVLAEHDAAPEGECDIADVVSGLLALHDATCAANRELIAENTSLRHQVAAWKGQTTMARGRQADAEAMLAEAVERDPGAKARVLPKERPLLPRRDAEVLQVLMAEVDGAGSVEVVAINGEREEVAIAPLALRGMAALLPVSEGLCLSIPRWEVRGPARVTGWALYIDGELAAYRPRPSQPEELSIGAGQVMNLAPDVIF